MGSPLNVYFSNRIERLYLALKGRLFSEQTDPFTKRFVIVPSPAMKTWLMTTMAQDPELGIAAGIQVTSLEPAVKEWAATLSQNTDFPKKNSELELSLRLELEIRKVAEQFARMSGDQKKIWKPLLCYIISSDKIPEKVSFKNKESLRILSLSAKLAHLFAAYGKYGWAMLKCWKEESGPKEWQAELWKRSVNELFPETTAWKKENAAVHLFGISFLSKQEHEMLLSMAEAVAVNYYLLSPCQMFWTDVLSNRECKKLVRYLESQNVGASKREALEQFLYDKNTLLANLGRLGREMALQIETSGAETFELYEIPKCILHMECYRELAQEEILMSQAEEAPTLLNAVQADLLLMRNPANGGKINFEKDASIQLLAACSEMREVQAVYDAILSIIHHHNTKGKKILPEEIVVMAPDIVRYEPYIKAVFSQYDNTLDYQLMDLNSSSHQPEVLGLLQLIALSNSRWEFSTVLQLFENPSFQAKHGLSIDDVIKIEKWVKAADVRWGKDPAHRKEALDKDLDEDCEIDPNPAGTWKSAFDRLILGMAMMVPEGNESFSLPALPLNAVDTSQTPLFGKWMRLMKQLSADLKILSDGTKLTLKEWSLYLKCLLESYLDVEKNEETLKRLMDLIDGFRLEKEFAGETFSFLSVQYHLERALRRERSEYRESHLHSVRFCSLLPMRAMPAKVIVLMGMSEENYPRTDDKEALNMLKMHPEADYCPSQSDFDRYLFLETILSARQYFIMSYTNCSKEDGKEVPPSLLVSELMGYLDGGYTLEGIIPSKAISVTCPFSPYDKKLFEKNSGFQSFSKMYYHASKAFYKKNEALPKHSFIQQFSLDKIPLSQPVKYVELKKLSGLARDPIELYFKETLGIYLKNEEDMRRNDEEDFVLDRLQAHLIKKNAIKRPLEEALDLAEKEGKLPLGPFRDYSVGQIYKDAEELQKNLANAGVAKEGIFQIKFNETFSEPQLAESGDWHLPPLNCRHGGRFVKVVGELSDISASGMLLVKDAKSEELVKAWPEYLVFSCLLRQYGLPIKDSLIFLKDGARKLPFFEDPFSHLEAYLGYYFCSLENPSPLFPDWIPEIVDNNPMKFQAKIQRTFSDEFSTIFSKSLKWISRDSKLPDHDIILAEWGKMAKDLFGGIFDNWKQSRKSAGREEEE